MVAIAFRDRSKRYQGSDLARNLFRDAVDQLDKLIVKFVDTPTRRPQLSILRNPLPAYAQSCFNRRQLSATSYAALKGRRGSGLVSCIKSNLYDIYERRGEKERTLCLERLKCRYASIRKIFKPGAAFLFSFLVRAVQQLPKIFSLGE